MESFDENRHPQLQANKTIAMAAKAAGAEVYIDSHDYQNGTERCAGAVASRKFTDYDQFINVQGDMPDVTLQMIEKAEWMLKHYSTSTEQKMFGFTEKSELIQGRLAMLGVIAALGAYALTGQIVPGLW